MSHDLESDAAEGCDDRVDAPAPPAQLVAPRFTPAAHVPPALDRTLFMRRTMIPILLTLGVLLPALAAAWFASDSDSVVRSSGRWLPVTLLVLGGILLLLAGINMAQVKHLLDRSERRPPGGRGV